MEDGMEGKTRERVKGKLPLRLMAAALFIIIAVVVSTWWLIETSQTASGESVYNVSEFYLKELSEQTSRLMQANLNEWERELHAAMNGLGEEELKDFNSLQDYIAKVEGDNQFDFFAVVDEDSTAYVTDGAASAAIQWLLDKNGNSLKEYFQDSSISVGGNEETGKMIFISLPSTGLMFGGKELIGGIAGLNTDALVEKLFLQDEEVLTFSSVITVEGDYVTRVSHTHLKEDSNVFSALSTQAEFEEESALDWMEEDIQKGKSGMIKYNLEGLLHYTYYAPIENTQWYSVTVMHYSTISEDVEIVRSTIVRNSRIQMVLILVMLGGLFCIYLAERRKTEAMRLEKVHAEERSKSKSLFLFNMSHDIRTPMNAIIGFAELALQNEGDKERVHDYLGKIKTSSGHLLSLLNDILYMSSIESGKIHLEPENCSLSDIFHDLEITVQSQVQEKRQKLSMNISRVTDMDIFCDKSRLSLVLLNLLSNAIKFTPEEGEISITAVQEEGGQEGYGSYEFKVKDTGIGMSPEFVKHVFEPFERERTSTVSKTQGTGLGMPIAKRIIDIMGGTIEVDTAPEKGTEYTVRVRLKVQEKESLQEELTQESGEEGQGFQGKRILLVEDNELNREIAMEILKEYGLEVEEAEDGTVAVQMMADSQPGYYDLILMDIQMPLMNGYEAARAIRGMENEELANIPIIALTANVSDKDKQEALESGMNGHAAKPIDVCKLMMTLEKFLG